MNKINFEKGTKRKCSACNTLFYDFNKTPLICPSCGSDVDLLTNKSKRGRPPKNSKIDAVNDKNKEELVIDEISTEEPEEVDDDEVNVESIIEIKKDDEN